MPPWGGNTKSMEESFMISLAEQRIRELDSLNELVFRLSEMGREKGLHDHILWKERLHEFPLDAVPLYPEGSAGQEKMVADGLEKLDEGKERQ